MFRKKYVTQSELNDLHGHIEEQLEVGSKIMTDLNKAIYEKPKNRNNLFIIPNYMWGGTATKPEPRSRIEVLEKKLDAIVKTLGIDVEWDSQPEVAEYKATKRPTPKTTKKAVSKAKRKK